MVPIVDPAKLIRMSLDLKRLAETLSPPTPARPVDADFVRQFIRAPRERDKHFSSDLFADPAWDMLLALYAARIEGRPLSVSSLCSASAVPPTTALRWITLLSSRDLIRRIDDPADKRRILVEITDDAFDRMNAYFAAVHRRGEGAA
jgi:DNA-binding MarR family transcriptional regulator